MPDRNTKPYDLIADRIIDALDQGVIPWRKPWSLPAAMRPQNSEGRPYNGVNALVLGLMPYQDPRWLTYRKAGELGGHVRKGEKSTPIVFMKQHQRDVEGDDGDTETKTYRVLRYFAVFNAEQCDGLNLAVIQAPRLFDPIEAAEIIVANMPHPPAMAHDGGNKAYYIPRLDTVHLPPREAFADGADYYATAFHELGHSTGHKSRLDREGIEDGAAPFGSPVYSREELVAEFAAAFVSHEAGITSTIENTAAYVQGWAKAIRKDKRLIVQAASQGQKAADYILGRSAA